MLHSSAHHCVQRKISQNVFSFMFMQRGHPLSTYSCIQALLSILRFTRQNEALSEYTSCDGLHFYAGHLAEVSKENYNHPFVLKVTFKEIKVLVTIKKLELRIRSLKISQFHGQRFLNLTQNSSFLQIMLNQCIFFWQDSSLQFYRPRSQIL